MSIIFLLIHKDKVSAQHFKKAKEAKPELEELEKWSVGSYIFFYFMLF